MEALQGRDGDKDDNCLLAVANFDLFQIQSQHASSRMTLQSLDRFPPYSACFHGCFDVMAVERGGVVPKATARLPALQCAINPPKKCDDARHAATTRPRSQTSAEQEFRRGFEATPMRAAEWCINQRILTSRAETNCRGRRATLRSAVLVSRSYSAPAMLVSSSEGFWRDGLFGAILLSWGALMMAVVDDDRVGRKPSNRFRREKLEALDCARFGGC